jgi:peptide/nickel transport system substrate-binding protein
MRTRVSVIFVTLLLAFSSVGLLAGNALSVSSSAASCPANDILYGATSPIPNSFNQLTAAGAGASHVISYIEDLSTTPFPAGPGGALVWDDSLTDWYTSNANYTQWTFNIKPGEMWSNGQPVTSQDMLDFWNSSFALNPQYDITVLHSEITQEKALNTSAFVFYLNQSDAHVPEELSSYDYTNVLPPSDVAQGPSFNDFGPFAAPGDVGTGPFVVTNYTSGASNVVMYRNPYYKPLPNACELVMYIADSGSAFIPLLAGGKADFAGPIDPADVSSINSIPNMHLWTGPALGLNTMWYNTSWYPYNQAAFRQALAYSINYSQLAQVALNGYAVPAGNAQGMISPYSNLYNPHVQNYTYDPTQALSLLNSIGITKGSDGHLHFSNGTVVSLTIFYETTFTYLNVEAQAISGYLNQLGMETTTEQCAATICHHAYHTDEYGIDHNMWLTSGTGQVYTDPYFAAQALCSVAGGCFEPAAATPFPETSVEKNFNGNLSIVDTSANVTAEDAAVNNIQVINAQYLPQIMLTYPDFLMAYSTARWTNWQANPSTNEFFVENHINKTMLATLQPVTGTVTTPNTQTGNQSITATTGTQTTSTGTTTSAPTSSTSYILIAAVVVVAIVVIAGVVLFRARRKPVT